MGINVYLKPESLVIAQEKQYSPGFYIRESYGLQPYPSQYLFSECFKNNSCSFNYTYELLKSRLLKTLNLAIERMNNDNSLYETDEIKFIFDSYIKFVENIKKYESKGIKCKVTISY